MSAAQAAEKSEEATVAVAADALPRYRYRLRSLGNSSVKYGNCGVCKEYASDVFIQIEERFYRIEIISREGWTQAKCSTLFGHRECLVAKQRGTKEVNE